MLTVIVPVLWIAFDVAICVRTAFMSAPMSWPEISGWFVVGLLLGLTALAAGWHEREEKHKDEVKYERDRGELCAQIERSAGFNQGSFERVNVKLDKISNASPDFEVKKEITQLKADLTRMQPRTLSQDQIEAMSGYLGTVPPAEKSPIDILIHPNNPEAARYGGELQYFLRKRGMARGLSTDTGIPSDLVGLIIRVKDSESRPPIVKHLAEAFRRAEIEHRIEVMQNLHFGFANQTDCQLVLGRKG
jgi:hypothetical protein